MVQKLSPLAPNNLYLPNEITSSPISGKPPSCTVVLNSLVLILYLSTDMKLELNGLDFALISLWTVRLHTPQTVVCPTNHVQSMDVDTDQLQPSVPSSRMIWGNGTHPSSIWNPESECKWVNVLSLCHDWLLFTDSVCSVHATIKGLTSHVTPSQVTEFFRLSRSYYFNKNIWTQGPLTSFSSTFKCISWSSTADGVCIVVMEMSVSMTTS